MNSFHPSSHAKDHPDRIACRFLPSGNSITYAQLDARSNQAAHLFRSLGLNRGDVIAILLENHPSYFELAWAADRAGLYYTGMSTRLTGEEAAYILKDSGARVLLASASFAECALAAVEQSPGCVCFSVDGPVKGLRDYMTEVEAFPTIAIADESCGAPMLYSSGTTGRPKGVKFALSENRVGQLDGLTALAIDKFLFSSGMIYLSPAPLYHAAPLRWSMCVQRIGGTVIVLEKFDPEFALLAIEREQVSHSQWVPTHFIRMLKLPAEVRQRYNPGSQKLVFHAAAPCPVAVKQAIIDWWGPIIHEYYAGTEFNGLTSITPQEWQTHPGSVGQASVGTIHICSDDGLRELSPREEGLVYFEGGSQFQYHNDPEKTAAAYNDREWSTLGDIGWIDEDGYLYLTDRKSFMIISGGVNIYPQEIENAIIDHPDVADVAVIGAPDEDLGEKVVAIVQPMDWSLAGPALAEDIRLSLAGKLSRVKQPRQIDFSRDLPRQPTGKLYKRLLRDQYWARGTGD